MVGHENAFPGKEVVEGSHRLNAIQGDIFVDVDFYLIFDDLRMLTIQHLLSNIISTFS